MKLQPKYREVLYLYYYEGYSVREVARILKRAESTVQTQLAAARKRLRTLLEEEGGYFDGREKIARRVLTPESIRTGKKRNVLPDTECRKT
ncbi:MAG: sigma factor-like helix-turn-helix DNA-binding protein [Eubacterium sp.]